ncbi:UDP-N-acetylglucosamine 2-epimerase (hydrolyzing) [Sphingobacteriales bacterium UPWRP_1]|nr:UDP-N-acetylglucosamine 2-epimerase (hydrolyzing) [Sphingobacteriales bacterium UPWRP_1]
MKISLLTSSRADYGIYLPLLKKLSKNKQYKLQIIAFGTHLSPFHGLTIKNILSDGFKIAHSIESMVAADSAEAIATAMALTTMKFSSLWALLHKKTDLIICLGDRYEMFAAVSASIPFNIPVAHFYGGETTLGAIDNKFRHAITQMATYHFVATAQYAQTVAALTNNSPFIYNVGALSLDNLENIALINMEEFKSTYNIDMKNKTMLVTFHPETVSAELNYMYVKELISALSKISYQIIITMPNADTMGSRIRTELLLFAKQNPNRVFAIENFGTQGYFSCMALCSFLLGNTSSGIIEAASFGKYVINLGNRQKGRACSNNVLHTPIKCKNILAAIKQVEKLPPYSGDNIYYKGNASQKIIDILQSLPVAATP